MARPPVSRGANYYDPRFTSHGHALPRLAQHTARRHSRHHNTSSVASGWPGCGTVHGLAPNQSTPALPDAARDRDAASTTAWPFGTAIPAIVAQYRAPIEHLALAVTSLASQPDAAATPASGDHSRPFGDIDPAGADLGGGGQEAAG